jgi:four helix bundle protein
MVLKVSDLEIFKLSEDLSDNLSQIVLKWNIFQKDTMGKQLIRAVDSISANIAEGHGRFHYKDRINFCYYARGSLEEIICWMNKARRRELMNSEKEDVWNIIKILPKKQNAYINSIKNAKNEKNT